MAAAPYGKNDRGYLARQSDSCDSRSLSARKVTVIDGSESALAERRMQRDVLQDLLQHRLTDLGEMNTPALLIPYRSAVLDSMLR